MSYEIFCRASLLTQKRFGVVRPHRHRRLYDFFCQTMHLDGAMMECGCYKGVGLHILCQTLKACDTAYKGENYYVIDSFEGLSELHKQDILSEEIRSKTYICSLEQVKENLAEFPDITYYKGWIPPILNKIEARSYRFVHIDVDLYEPTQASLEYFYDKMVPGGLIVCDDFNTDWRGAKKAIKSFIKKYNLEDRLNYHKDYQSCSIQF